MINVFRTGLLLGCSAIAVPAAADVASARAGITEYGMVDAATATETQPATDIVVVGSPEEADLISGSFATVTNDDLRRTRVLNVNDALRQVTGVFVRDEEGAGMRPNIGIRGLNPIRSTKVLLLEDGVPLSFAPYGDNASYYHPPIQRFRVPLLGGTPPTSVGYWLQP